MILKKILLLALLSIGLHASMHAGDKAQGFTLPSIVNDTSHTLSEFKGEVVLLNLWASWCKGCKKEMPLFFDLKKANPKGFEIVTVSVDDNPKNASHFLAHIAKNKGFSIPFVALHDTDKKVAKAYGCTAMPSSYLIDKHGVIREIIIGSLNAQEMKALQTEINRLK